MQSSVEEAQASTADTNEAACERCEIQLGLLLARRHSSMLALSVQRPRHRPIGTGLRAPAGTMSACRIAHSRGSNPRARSPFTCTCTR